MKNWTFTLFLLAFAAAANATHIVGGALTYQPLGNNDYAITLTIYRDCYNGEPYFDDPMSVGVFNDDPSPMLIGNYHLPLDYSQVDTVSILPANFVCVFPGDICIDKAVYTGVITLPSSGKFTVAYQRCCRTQILSNLVDPLNAGMTFFTVIDNAIANASPVFNQDIPVAIFNNVPFIYDGGATDPDGDSLVYSLSTPYHGASYIDPMPSVPAPPPYSQLSFLAPTYSESNMLGGNYPLTIDAETGEFSAIPMALGAFQIAYKVDEYRNGQLIGTTYRDFAFVVVPPEPTVNFDVSGKVYIDSTTTLDTGLVQLLVRDISDDSLYLYGTYPVTAGGDYHFENIPPGVFYLRAFPDASSMYYADYLPTYYQGSLFWYDAIPVNQCDTSQLYRDIYLVPVDPIPASSQTIQLKGIVKNGTTGEVVQNLSLLLSDPNNRFYQHAKTNSYGMFTLTMVNGGYYTIYVDKWNSSVHNAIPPLFIASNNASKIANFELEKDRLKFMGYTQSASADDVEKVLSLRPNPTSGKFTILLPEFYLMGGEKLTIWNVNGQAVLNQELKATDKLDLQLSTAGLYFIKLATPVGTWSGKVLVQ
ncbi:MAG: T9SS type A sorting domain-containing protein [Saprospiraceae bacterium]|nr:T9SS type A sorting domain-containing protein [Saprospiraceae bacterium]